MRGYVQFSKHTHTQTLLKVEHSTEPLLLWRRFFVLFLVVGVQACLDAMIRVKFRHWHCDIFVKFVVVLCWKMSATKHVLYYFLCYLLYFIVVSLCIIHWGSETGGLTMSFRASETQGLVKHVIGFYIATSNKARTHVQKRLPTRHQNVLKSFATQGSSGSKTSSACQKQGGSRVQAPPGRACLHPKASAAEAGCWPQAEAHGAGERDQETP